MVWKEIEIEIRKEAIPWDYHEKGEIEGRIGFKKMNVDAEGRRFFTTILETDEGDRYFLPRNIDLQWKLRRVEEGDRVRIIHEGEKELESGHVIRRFRLYRWEEE